MDLFDLVCRELNSCRGKASAITLAILAERVHTSRREVEQVIEQRLSDFPWPIVAGSVGVYIPTEADDLNTYIHQLHSRHRRMQLREATIRRKARLDGWIEEAGRFIDRPVQQELFV